MSDRKWLIAAASTLAGAVLLGKLVHPVVGSGLTCEGIGFACTPERDLDTLLIVTVYAIAASVTLLVVRRRARRGRDWRKALMAGIAISALATAATVRSQLPRHQVSPGSLSAARDQWERVLADGEALAPRGTALGEALRGLRRRGPLICRDAYDRATDGRVYRWSNRADSDTYTGSTDGSGAVAAAALAAWADRLRGRGVSVTVSDPGGNPASDRRLQVGGYGPVAGGVLYVRASFYIPALEISVDTGCHRD